MAGGIGLGRMQAEDSPSWLNDLVGRVAGLFGYDPELPQAMRRESRRMQAEAAGAQPGQSVLEVAGPPVMTDDQLHIGMGLGGALMGALKSKDFGYEPKQTQTAYKLFRTDKEGNLYPLFVDANERVPMNEWLRAEAGQPAGDGKVKSKLGPLAYRPGWHAGDLPIATHIGGKSDPSLKAPDYRPDNQVWAEIEMAADRDWQSIANERARITKAGKPDPKTAHITDQVPVEGFYRYKTNPHMTGQWLIGGDMRVNRILSDEEVKAINDAAGVADLPRRRVEGDWEFLRPGEDGRVLARPKGEAAALQALQEAGPGHALRKHPTFDQFYLVKELEPPAAPEPTAVGLGEAGEPRFIFKDEIADQGRLEEFARALGIRTNDEPNLGDRGKWTPANKSITMNAGLDPDSYHHTFTHELGHGVSELGGTWGGLISIDDGRWQMQPPAPIMEGMRALSRDRRPHLWAPDEELERGFAHVGAKGVRSYRERPSELAADLVASMMKDPLRAKEIARDAYYWAAERLNTSDIGKIARFLGIPVAVLTSALWGGQEAQAEPTMGLGG